MAPRKYFYQCTYIETLARARQNFNFNFYGMLATISGTCSTNMPWLTRSQCLSVHIPFGLSSSRQSLFFNFYVFWPNWISYFVADKLWILRQRQ